MKSKNEALKKKKQYLKIKFKNTNFYPQRHDNIPQISQQIIKASFFADNEK